MTATELKRALKEFTSVYSKRGYEYGFVFDNSSGNYMLRLSKGSKSATIRDGYINGRLSLKPRELTSFDIILTLEDKVFLKYISDYALEEYSDHLVSAFEIIDAFFEGSFNITSEKYFIFQRKNYLNLQVGDHEEHLLQTGKSDQ